MINFKSITLEAKDIIDIFHNPVELQFNDEGGARELQFYNGDCADVYLTDGSQFLIQFENGKWICREFIEREPHIDDLTNNGDLTTMYGPYELLEDALNDLIAKKNYLTLN